MNKIWLLGIVFLFFISVFSVNAENFGTFSFEQPINIIQTCTTCTYVNITSITAPNSTLLVGNAPMSKYGSKFNYTLPGQSTVGQYIVCGVGNVGGHVTDWCYVFYVTKTGTTSSTAQSIIYFILLAISVGLFILCMVISFNIDPSKYNKDGLTERFTGINWKRYYKYAAWCIAYLMAVWMMNLCYEISQDFLKSGFITEFFRVFYFILLALAFPLFVYLCVMVIIALVADKKAEGYIKRGLQP